MTFWVIYDHPRDYPAYYVVRAHDQIGGLSVPRSTCSLATTLAEARSHLPAGAARIPRYQDDDPCILEVYMEAA